MKRDFLENLGLEADVIDKVMSEHGKDITSFKTEIATLKDDLKVRDGVIQNKNSKIQELEKINIDELKEQEFSKGKEAGLSELNKFKFESAMESELKKHNIRDVEAIKGFLNTESIKFEDGKISGLDEQITPLKEKKSYLFNEDSRAPKFSSTTRIEGSTSSEDNVLREVFGLKSSTK